MAMLSNKLALLQRRLLARGLNQVHQMQAIVINSTSYYKPSCGREQLSDLKLWLWCKTALACLRMPLWAEIQFGPIARTMLKRA